MNDSIKEKGVQQAIKSLKNNKNTGPDQIKNEFIKYGRDELTKSLSQTFNKKFENETRPIYGTNQIPPTLIKDSQRKNY